MYDVIITGSGLGGLECGVILSKEGYKVCVLEKHHIIGGCLQSFKRNGIIFYTGIHYVGSLSEGQIFNQYNKYLGIADKLHLKKMDEEVSTLYILKDSSTFMQWVLISFKIHCKKDFQTKKIICANTAICL